MNDYLPTTVWRHGMDGPEPGIRVMPSFDRPGEVVLQIRHDANLGDQRPIYILETDGATVLAEAERVAGAM